MNGIQIACHLLSALVFSLFVLMTVLRSKSRGRERTPLAVDAAVVTSVAKPTVSGTRDHEFGVSVGVLLGLTGMLFSVYALTNLGRCFGVLADARGVVTKGATNWFVTAVRVN